MKYGFVIEKAPHNFAAYIPDLPGIVATGKAREEVERRIREGIEIYRLDSAWERFRAAVHIMAESNGTVQQRLAEAYFSQFAHLDNTDLPEDIRADFAEFAGRL